VDPRAGVDAVVKRKLPAGNRTAVIQIVVCILTELSHVRCIAYTSVIHFVQKSNNTKSTPSSTLFELRRCFCFKVRNMYAVSK
jgi:hypothetical protein